MTTLTSQMEDLLHKSDRILADLGITRVIAKPKLTAAIAEVRRSYSDDKIVSGPWGHKSCVQWAKDGLAASSINFNWTCGKWAANLKLALTRLAEALVGAGEKGWAEVAWSLADQSETMAEQMYATVAESFDPIAAEIPTADPDAGGDARKRDEADRDARKSREWIMRNLWWTIPAAATAVGTWYFWPFLAPLLRFRSGAGKMLNAPSRQLPAPSGQPNFPMVTDFAGLSGDMGFDGSFVGFSEMAGASLMGGSTLGASFVDATWEPIED